MIYRSAEGRAAVGSAYAAWLGRLPRSVGSRLVPTTRGPAHVLTVETGDSAQDAAPVVLLSGTNFPAPVWERLLLPLSRGFIVHAVDLPGQPGRSAAVRLPHRGDAYPRWLTEVLDALELGAAHLVGHSLGARIALHTAAVYPERVHRLALICPAGIMRLRVPPAMLLRTTVWLLRPRPSSSRALLALMSQPYAPADDHLVDWMTLVGRHVRTSLAPPPLPAAILKQVTAPTLVLAGESDPFLPAAALIPAARRKLPVADAETVRPGGHLLTHDRPEAVAGRLVEFLGAAD